MRWWRALSIVLIGASSACWTFHEEDGRAPQPTAGTCAGTSCAPMTPPPDDPFTTPRRCIEGVPDSNPGDKLCRAGELSVHCVMAPPLLTCPATLREGVLEACKDGAEAYRVACNACGGLTVELTLQFFSLDIHFDAEDKLAGVTLTQPEPVGPCEQEEFVFGRHCTSTGARETRSCSQVRSAALVAD